MMQFLAGINPYMLFAVILACVMLIAAMLYLSFRQWTYGKKTEINTDTDSLYDTIEAAGYSYDPWQDIFYSNMDPWQRKMGYCRLYDEASAPLNMIIDCEPVYFEYDNKKWLIELWKGQYGMAAGGEIGVYTANGTDLDIPGFFNGTFYYCAGDEDRLYMSYSLLKDGEELMARSGKHWWLTGFKLGAFAEPSELTMRLTIALKDGDMLAAFREGLEKAGYSEDDIYIEENTVSLVYDKPRTPQPLSRIPETDWIIQRKNELLCNKYQELTVDYDNFPDKMDAIRKLAPELYDTILNIGRPKALYDAYEKIKAYLS